LLLNVQRQFCAEQATLRDYPGGFWLQGVHETIRDIVQHHHHFQQRSQRCGVKKFSEKNCYTVFTPLGGVGGPDVALKMAPHRAAF
jgi:(2Fe-2S) ferredoxin